MSELDCRMLPDSRSIPLPVAGFDEFTHMFVRMGKASEGDTIPSSN
jgi:hypothetical protein